jgi:hypothetical protein
MRSTKEGYVCLAGDDFGRLAERCRSVDSVLSGATSRRGKMLGSMLKKPEPFLFRL